MPLLWVFVCNTNNTHNNKKSTVVIVMRDIVVCRRVSVLLFGVKIFFSIKSIKI
jgi:hypothetical protein